MKKLSLLLLIVSMFSCHVVSTSEVDESISSPSSIKFLAFGDWGRMGSQEQISNAEHMGSFADQNPLDFILSTGDNFYDNGVASTEDPHWTASFEDVYHHTSLMVPWYVVLGNHDYRGNVDAQIAYKSPNNDRWHLPARHYVKVFNKDSLKVALIILDTSPTETEYYSENKYKAVWDQDSSAQKLWFRSVMDTLTANYIFVAGHHPLYSGGKRLEETYSQLHHWEPLFRKYPVTAYLCGHEHDLQIHEADLGHQSPFLHIITGAGSEVRPTGTIPEESYAGSDVSTKFALSQNGFTVVECGVHSGKITLHSKGKKVYHRAISPL